jgi:hypothetical protein
MLIEQVQRQEVGSKLTITEEEARQYYAQHPVEFTDPASVTARDLHRSAPEGGGVNVAKDDRSRKIEDVRARALKAEDFRSSRQSPLSSKANGADRCSRTRTVSQPWRRREDEAGRHHAAHPPPKGTSRSSSKR